MKRLLLALIIFIPATAYCQDGHFEGIVKFNSVYSAINPDVDINSYYSFFGNGYTSYIKPGYYRQDYHNSAAVKFAIYNYKTNRYYFKFNGVDTIYFIDCGNNQNIKDKFESLADTLTVLGHKCKAVSQSNSKMNSVYYYAKDLPIDPKYYVRHKMGGYDELTAITKSVYLMLVSDMGNVKCVTTADTIIKRNLDDSIFALPDLPLKKQK